jgi:aromatic ring hydroxylase
MVGLATAVPYVDEIFIPAGGRPPALPEQSVWFAVPINAPGVRVFPRQPAARPEDPYLFPLSTRYDELDAQTEFNEVFVPWERVFAYRDPEFATATAARDQLVAWLLWHHLLTYLARAEFSLGLALALVDTFKLQSNRGVVESIIDLVVATETIRTALRAAELDCTITPAGLACPNQMHLASGTLYIFQHRQRMAEIVRNIAGQGGQLAPSLEDLQDPEVGPSLERAFGGGGYSAAQRVALLHLAHDHVASALDAREAAFETHASLGESGWRMRVQRWFQSYNDLANGVVAVLGDMPKVEAMPEIDLADLGRIGFYG